MLVRFVLSLLTISDQHLNLEKIMYKLDQIMNGSIQEINAYFREIDESHLWPICNKFDVTERAIRRLRKHQMYNGGPEYFYALDTEISTIVNATV